MIALHKRLDEVCDITMGQAPDGESYNTEGNGLPLIAGAGDFGELHPAPKKFTRSPGKTCVAGDIVLGIRATIGEKVLADREYCLGRGVAGLKPKVGLDRRYLWHWLTNSAPVLAAKAKGATFKQVNREDIGELHVSVLPLPDQRRIAEMLDRAEALRTKRRATLAQLDILTEAIFLDMFGDPAVNPKKWQVRTIGEISEVKGGKRLPKGEEYSPTPTPYRYIRVVDLKAGAVDESALVYLKPEIQAGISRYIVNTGDVIISIAGSIGLIAAVPATLDGANLTENAAKLVPRASNVYDSVFLAAFLLTQYGQSQIGSHVGQVTIGKLALFRIEKIRVPVPPLALQHEFARRVTGGKALRAIHCASRSELDALFASLQHRAFNSAL